MAEAIAANFEGAPCVAHLGPDGAGHLVLSPRIAERLNAAIPALRRVVAAGALGGVALPAFGAALAWYDSMRVVRGTSNLIQAQRDFFDAHGFERVDQEGKFNTDWPKLSREDA